MYRKALIFFLIFSIFISISCSHNSDESIYSSYYNQLDLMVDKKKQELSEYFSLIEKAMQTIEKDGPVIQSFQILNNVFCAYKYDEPINNTSVDIEELDKRIQETYIERFMIFDNIYFINPRGDVFYTLKKEPPFMDNLNESKYIKTSLSKTLRSNPSSFIVDFDIFTENDPSAFFLYPVRDKKEIIGWCVFQFSADRLENIFAYGDNPGMTSEVFMVNEQDYMLTNSSFSPEPSALKLHLSNDNISRKFALGSGHLEIEDYRGYKTLTSFQVIEFHGVRWLIISKIDKDEIITERFKLNPGRYYNLIRNKTRTREKHYRSDIILPESDFSVKLDQYKRIYKEGSLYTHGVSSCTAVLVTLPGTFSYLAHISAYDKLYGGTNTDIIGSILNSIRKYEIPDYLIRELRIYIVTPQIHFSENILDYLTDQGIFLSQIHIVKNPEAQWANIYSSIEKDNAYVEWHMKNGDDLVEDLQLITNVGEILDSQNVEK